MTTRFDISTMAEALAARAAEVAMALLGEPNRPLSSRRELRFRRKGSLAVVIDGAKAGRWYDHEDGVGGDLIHLIERERGVTFREAVAYAEQFVASALTLATTPAPGACGRSAEVDSKRDQRRAGNRPASQRDIFRARCEARALLFAAGQLDLHDAVDLLQADAVAKGLVVEIGLDAVQEIMAVAFGQVRQ
jgi:hypothetical protein